MVVLVVVSVVLQLEKQVFIYLSQKLTVVCVIPCISWVIDQISSCSENAAFHI